MLISEITKKNFLGKLKGDSHIRVLNILHSLRKEYFPKYSGIKMKVSSEKSEHPPLHCKYKIYVHFPPAEEVLAYQKGTATLHDIIAARTATTGALTRQLSKMLDKEFPPKGKVQATPQLSAIKHGERYLISIWLFVHS